MKLQQSPVNVEFPSKLIDEINSGQVANHYKDAFGIDITRFIKSDSLKKFRCEITDLEFYRGIDAGDGKFYSDLMKFDWYYNPWKWEHEMVKQMLKSNESLVEIGCGSGGFLKGIRDLDIKSKGLEINIDALNIAQKQGLDVTNDNLKSFSKANESSYDWCVSFQVLEHIEPVGEFLSNSVKLLKQGGKLVISVPNNDSFFGETYNLMNLPPHHMNRWNKESLKKIAPLFGLEFNSFEFEPLQSYHYNWYVSTILESERTNFNKKLPILKGIVYRETKKILDRWIAKEAENIVGHSIMATYTKK